MQLAFHGATTIKANLETDILNSQLAGYSALEIWTVKLDVFLENHSVTDLKTLLERHKIAPKTLNSIEAIGFRGAEFSRLLECCAGGRLAHGFQGRLVKRRVAVIRLIHR